MSVYEKHTPKTTIYYSPHGRHPKGCQKMQELGSLPEAEFCNPEEDHFDVAKLRMREALEGVFNIGAHILSRIEGGRPTEYKDIAKKLGEFGVVDKEFADGALTRMAGYRNRLTHFYADITAPELYKIIRNNLGDFDAFLGAVKKLLADPEKFNISVE